MTTARGEGLMTLHDYGYLPPVFLELSCFGVIFSNIHPASESGFLPGDFFGGIYCYANFLCYANFSIVFYCFQTNCFWGEGQILGANCMREKPAVSRTMYQNTERVVFKGNPNKFLYCMSCYNCEYVENIKTWN